ncbi:alpha/beta hydrolase [Rhodopirellula sp. MGV]|uniref:alpha/beta hydrolase n=1 Tax=Rhodopirellula sp. MGV TaxID=2023130 RepID=UPI000B97B531|nr:hypothetical protein [Rhodopirellula sp. MGV]OYP37640.1 hypothetical protein CGZ80_04760 [Rhodopirellula sp. MGV]PNY34958.1 lysophospholipase [Rhodopirellula baltica]
MMYPQQIRLGSLDCFSIDPSLQSTPADVVSDTSEGGGAVPSAIVVLCHGYGAPGSDMVGVAQSWVQLLGETAKQLWFLCPIAPLSLAEFGMPTGRAWWPLNMARMMEAVQAQRFEQLHRETPPGLDQARNQLSSLIHAAQEQLGKRLGKPAAKIPLAIGGFSQGAMLTMDTALRGDIPAPDQLFQFSGTVVCQPQWAAATGRLEQTRVFQAHGTVDPILPFSSAERLRDLLKAAEVDLEFHSFYGPHTIDEYSVETTAMMLKQLPSAKDQA